MLSQFMFMIYLVLLNIYHIGNANASATCRKTEYQIGEYCCPTCPAGMRVQKHCTMNTSTSCKPCSELTYQDARNGLTQCFPCTNCDPGLGLKVKKLCTRESDALCEPLDGHFCIHLQENECMAAQTHKACNPGQYISQRGTAYANTVCLECKSGTFSVGNSPTCQPHTICESKGLKQIKPGDDSTDSECEDHLNTEQSNTPIKLGLIIAVIIIIIIIGVLVAWFFKRKMVKRTTLTRPPSTQETQSMNTHTDVEFTNQLQNLD